jgi:26S proteasome regulatory subunit T1
MFGRICRKRLAHRLYSSTAPIPQQLQTEQLVEQLLLRPSKCLKLSTLVSFGQPLTSDSLLSSVNYVFEEIPRRLAMRVRSLEDLPYIVGLNPWISRVLQVHSSSFHRLATYPRVSTPEENNTFVTELEKIVNAHANDIPQMAKGYVWSLQFIQSPSNIYRCPSLQECSRYMTPEQTSDFLNGAIRNRIAVRLIAEQHIALSHALGNSNSYGNHFGVIDMKCRPANLVRYSCFVFC